MKTFKISANLNSQERSKVTLSRSEKIAQQTAAREWAWSLPLPLKGLLLSSAGSLVLAQAALAEHVDLENVNLFDVQCGVAFASAMVAAGYWLNAQEGGGHGEGHGEAKEQQEVCILDDAGGFKLEMQDPEVDFYRETLIRYLGYSNECGEAFRPLVGDLGANLTYVVAVSYVMADAVDKAKRASKSSVVIRANEMFKQLDTTAQGYLTYPDVKAAFKELDVSVSDTQVDAFLRKANVLQGDKISYKEFMWALEREDSELELLLEAGAKTSPGPYFWGSQTPGKSTTLSAVRGVDALIWQLTASVIMPGFTINRIVTLTAILLAQYGPQDGVLAQVAPYIPTAVGLGVIPFIVAPLDMLAEVLLDVTIRKFAFDPLTATSADSLSEDELVKKLEGRPVSLPQKYLVEIFQKLDEDKDGQVSVKDWSTKGLDVYEEYKQKYGSASQA
eukprot:CAMPEP_0196580006 /NCGR_PEP_ID=MMETSP1081-20130531/26244_1 /TAXON_ID=36882 /ORGANISM="Pyramimonas amylifera, Strain CCMP720" /LENGTH=445 /DNA_ID=CAMNT_0041899755 /DNA_START=286 /DNA_END=1623 /DNA_ORIENTATION=+